MKTSGSESIFPDVIPTVTFFAPPRTRSLLLPYGRIQWVVTADLDLFDLVSVIIQQSPKLNVSFLVTFR